MLHSFRREESGRCIHSDGKKARVRTGFAWLVTRAARREFSTRQAHGFVRPVTHFLAMHVAVAPARSAGTGPVGAGAKATAEAQRPSATVFCIIAAMVCGARAWNKKGGQSSHCKIPSKRRNRKPDVIHERTRICVDRDPRCKILSQNGVKNWFFHTPVPKQGGSGDESAATLCPSGLCEHTPTRMLLQPPTGLDFATSTFAVRTTLPAVAMSIHASAKLSAPTTRGRSGSTAATAARPSRQLKWGAGTMSVVLVVALMSTIGPGLATMTLVAAASFLAGFCCVAHARGPISH